MPILDPSNQPKIPAIPCRTCTDFKTWAKQQREVMEETQNKKPQNLEKSVAETMAQKHGCPYDKDDLGRSTWGLLHTMAANYPDEPSVKQVGEMTNFISILSRFYPCEFCAKDFQQEIKEEPIKATSQEAFSQWLCRAHNKVNVKIGKPQFDCTKVNQRWRDGWLDGSCDQ